MSAITLPIEKNTYLFGGVGLVLCAIVFLVFWHVAQPRPAIQPEGEALVTRDLRFEDQADGGIRITDAVTGLSMGAIAPGEGAFVRGALRGLVRDRRAEQIGPQIPFRLSMRSNNALLLEDLATGRWIDLRAFGTTNTGAFLELLQK